MTKERLFPTLFGLASALIVVEFWISYFAFCRFNQIYPFNGFVHRYPMAGGGLIYMMLGSILAGIIAARFRKWWVLPAIFAFGTLMFIFSQIT
jgi:hypothetical protein